MKNKKWILQVCIIVGAVAIGAIGLLITAGVTSAKGYAISVGRLYLSDTALYLVDEGKAMIMSDQSDEKDLFDGLNTGDLVLVVHGGVDDSYPSRTGAHRIYRLSKGNESDLPKNLDLGVVSETSSGGSKAPSDGIKAQYVRCGRDGEKYPIAKIIRSVSELNAYCEENKEDYGLGYEYNNAISFLDACEKYNDAYFKDNILILVLLEEGSGSIRHKVQSVRMTEEGKCQIYINRIIPEMCTADMAWWHILIEQERDNIVEKDSDIVVFVDGIDPHSGVTGEQK